MAKIINKYRDDPLLFISFVDEFCDLQPPARAFTAATSTSQSAHPKQ